MTATQKDSASTQGQGAQPWAVAAPSTWRIVLVCTLITLVGVNLRTIILAVPPVLPLLKHDLALSYAAVGFLTAIPTLVLGGGAWLSGLLIERIGGRSSVTIGLALLAAGALLRAIWPLTLPLFLFTFVLSTGIALAQTSIPVLARRWFPAYIGLVTALFTDGLIVGETIGASGTVPIMAHFLGKDAWAGTFVLWGAPVVVLLALWLWLAPRSAGGPAVSPLADTSAVRSSRLADREAVEAKPRCQPSFNVRPATINRALQDGPRTQQGEENMLMRQDPTPTGMTERNVRKRVNALHLGILLGAGSLIYFGMNGWIATYNSAISHSELTPLTLLLLNAAQIPSSLLVTFFAQQLAGRRWPFVIAGIICTIAITGWIFTPVLLEPLWAALLGGSSALVFTLSIALPALIATSERVARLTGLTLSLGYGVAFLGPLFGGELWDLFRLPSLAFLPVVLASITLIILGALLPPRAAFGLVAHATH